LLTKYRDEKKCGINECGLAPGEIADIKILGRDKVSPKLKILKKKCEVGL